MEAKECSHIIGEKALHSSCHEGMCPGECLTFGVPFFGVPILLRFIVYWVYIGVPLFGEITISPIILTVVLAETWARAFSCLPSHAAGMVS